MGRLDKTGGERSVSDGNGASEGRASCVEVRTNEAAIRRAVCAGCAGVVLVPATAREDWVCC